MTDTARLKPASGNAVADYWHEKAIEAADLWRLPIAEVYFQRALAVQDMADVRTNYANTLRRAWRLDEALREGSRAFQQVPDSLPVQGSVGAIHLDRGEFAKAIEMLRAPGQENSFYEFCRSLALLWTGQYEEGWNTYEARLERMKLVYQIEPWAGQDLTGKVIAIHHEQGFGDTIMYSRFLDCLPEGTDYLFGLPSPLMRLFKHKYGERAQSAHAQLIADYACPMMSVPARFGLKDLPPFKPYLEPPIKFVVPRPPMTKLAVGIVWTSKAGGRDMRKEEEVHGVRKSIPLEMLLPLAGVPGVSLFGLQNGEACRDIDRLHANDIVLDLGWNSMDFADLAGFIEQMDLIVTIDSAPAHLAGAMGKPCIVLLNAMGSWQWQTGKHTPWYGDNLEVIRQPKPFDWESVAAELLENVRSRV